MRVILYLPIMISAFLMGRILYYFAQYDGGVWNDILALFGVDPVYWTKTGMSATVIQTAMNIWQYMALCMLIYLSGLQGIPMMYREAARLDGANAWQRFCHISVPLVRPTTIYVLTISIYGGLAMFVESRMLFANTELGNQALTIVGYLYRVGIRKMNYGLGSAIGISLLVLTLAVNLIQLTLTGFFRKE